MKQIIILMIFIYTTSYSYQFKLNDKDWKYINNSNNKNFIKNRLNKYQSLKEKIVNYKLIRKLSHVNAFLNKIFYKEDIDTQLSVDYWATPKEFLLQGYGDCEDYAISKYFTLLDLGISKEKLYFGAMGVKGVEAPHIVLLYLENKHSSPLVLDNLSFKVLPLTKRKKLIPKFAFNEIDSYKFTKEGFTKKIKVNWKKDNKWNNLLTRVYKHKE